MSTPTRRTGGPAPVPPTGPSPAPREEPMPTLLEVDGLTTVIDRRGRRMTAVEDISLRIGAGQVLAVVGETGSGKSLTALSVLGLLRSPVSLAAGEVRLEGTDLARLPAKQRRRIRGGKIGMVFQDPMTALNPYHTVAEQLTEAIRLHRRVPRARLREHLRELLSEVGIVNPELRLKQYPHELSGGTQQRVMIAMALANRPQLLVADEPTTGLDATVQAQILTLIGNLARSRQMGVLIITHDLGVVSAISDRTVVLYAGQVVEAGTTRDVLRAARHPYTRALLEATPRPDERQDRLRSLPGGPPELGRFPVGCRFAPRCPVAREECSSTAPELTEITVPTGDRRPAADPSGIAAPELFTPASSAPGAAPRADPATAPTTGNRPEGAAATVTTDRVRCLFPLTDGPDTQVRRSGAAAPVDHRPGAARAAAPGATPEVSSPVGEPGEIVLTARALVRHFAVRGGTTRAVDGVDLEIRRGETLGVVGESGCGKSTLARLLAHLDTPTAGSVDHLPGRPRQRRDRRAEASFAQFVFQDTFGALDPRRTVGQTIGEPLEHLTDLDRAGRHEAVLAVMTSCGLPTGLLGRYPHELSGGQRQRVGIARALVTRPDLVVMDEPMSGLDVSVQAQIVNLLQDLRQEIGLTTVLVSHDVGVIRHLADRVAVMYLGRVVETGPAATVLTDPEHPYTAALLSAVPSPDPDVERTRAAVPLRGEVGDVDPDAACSFAARCPAADSLCRSTEPQLRVGAHGTQVACHHPGSVSTTAPTRATTGQGPDD